MLNEFLNKQVEVLVAFATGFVSGGAVPDSFKGILVAVEDDYCKLRLLKSKGEHNIIVIATKFIITVREI